VEFLEISSAQQFNSGIFLHCRKLGPKYLMSYTPKLSTQTESLRKKIACTAEPPYIGKTVL